MISKIFIIVGVLLLSICAFLIYQRNTPRRLAFNIKKVDISSHSSSSVFPKVVMIKDLHITLPIFPARMKNNSWEATSEGVSYLTSSSIPGEKGNSILYGHNWPNLLGKLPEVKPGQVVEILYQDGTIKKFIIQYTSVVTPDDISILSPSKDKRLTLYTCTGFLDTKRFVVTALLKG